jgi:transketolase
MSLLISFLLKTYIKNYGRYILCSTTVFKKDNMVITAKSQKNTEELKKIADSVRLSVFKAIHSAGGGHFGGTLSCVEILTMLYFNVMRIDPKNPNWPQRDRFILAKGHAGPTLYVILSELGYFPKEWLSELDQSGGRLPKHVDRLKTPGIEVSSGPLGQGLSVGVGMALSAKMDSSDVKVYVLLGDGECNEGQVWEAVMTAAKYKLDNLIAIVDRNRLQIDGSSDEVMPMEPFEDKWKSFNWNVLTADGHDFSDLEKAFDAAKIVHGKPTVIIADTTKGKGVSFMENQHEWHSGSITEEQYKKGLADLGCC